jgi:hypothetical protein
MMMNAVTSAFLHEPTLTSFETSTVDPASLCSQQPATWFIDKLCIYIDQQVATMGYRFVLLVTVGLLAVWLASAEDTQSDGMRPQYYGNHRYGEVRHTGSTWAQ